jgi:hypothetical protein
MPNDQMTTRLPDVDAMIGIGGMADDPLVFLVEGVHGPPSERDPPLRFARVVGQSGLCQAARWALRPSARTVYQDVDPKSWCRLVCPLASSTPSAIASSGKYATG